MGDCAITKVIATFTSPVLSDFQVVEHQKRRPVIQCLITAAEGPHRLTLTNPKMVLTPDMSPSEIAEKMEGKWAEMCICEERTQELVSYGLDFQSEECFEFTVRVQKYTAEQVT